MPTVIFLECEWESVKAASNVKDHGVTFEEAALALRDPYEVATPDAKYPDRVDSLVMSPRARVLLVVTTEAAPRTRIISARKATPHEQRTYAQDR